jgi:hypothetical protein
MLGGLRALLDNLTVGDGSTLRPADAPPDGPAPDVSREDGGDDMSNTDDANMVDYVDILLDRLGTPPSRIVVGGLGESPNEAAQAAPSEMGGDISAYPQDVQDAIRAIAPEKV